jgi:hypothetical protein
MVWVVLHMQVKQNKGEAGKRGKTEGRGPRNREKNIYCTKFYFFVINLFFI